MPLPHLLGSPKHSKPSLRIMSADSDVMIVEGVGGARVPLDGSHTVVDLAVWLKLPTVIVARPNLGTINHTLLTLDVLRAAGVKVVGVVINRYPAESANVAEETNPRMIEQWGKIPILCIVPDEQSLHNPYLPKGVIAAIETVDWQRLAQK